MTEKWRRNIYRRWVTSSLEALHSGVCVLAVVLYLLSGLLGVPEMRTASCILLFLDAISYLAHLNQSRIYSYVNSNQRVSHLPERQMRRRNTALLALFLGMTTVVIVIVLMMPYEGMANWVGTMVYRLISSVLLAIFNVEVYTGPVESQSNGNESYAENHIPAQGNDHLWADWLEQWIVVGAVGFAAVMFCVMLYWLWRRLLSARRVALEEDEDLPDAQVEHIHIERKRAAHLSLWDRSPNARVRRLYIRRLRHGLAHGVPPEASLTPTELEQRAGVAESIGSLHDLYEKARYAREGCSKEEVRTML